MNVLGSALFLCAVGLFGVLLSQTTHPRKTSFDLATDFLFAQSPESVWQYGYSTGNSLSPAEFRRDAFFDKLTPTCFWHPATNDLRGPGYYPYVAYNTGKQSTSEPTHGWAVRGGEVAMEASNSGQYSLVRFSAPAGGQYRIMARFEGIHFRLSSTDVHVLHNSEHLFDSEIDGYGGDPNFHKIEGEHPTAGYEGLVSLESGDTVTFAVGYGTNKTNYNDTTGLYARLVWHSRKP